MLSDISQNKEKQIPYDLTKKYREQIGGYQREGGMGGKMGEGSQKVHTSCYKINVMGM